MGGRNGRAPRTLDDKVLLLCGDGGVGKRQPDEGRLSLEPNSKPWAVGVRFPEFMGEQEAPLRGVPRPAVLG